jgi:hypothetical protein
MKVTPWDDVLSGSVRVRQRNPAPHGADESLFSLLLKVESQLRAETKDGAQRLAERRKPSKVRVSQRSTHSNLSRYIE